MNRRWIVQQAPWPVEARPFSLHESEERLIVRVGECTVDLEIADGSGSQGWCWWKGRLLPFAAAADGKQLHLWLAGESFVFGIDQEPPRRSRGAGDASAGLAAQVPGKVLRILVREGDRVEPGQTLVIIESMKMEFLVRARVSGVVKRVLVELGAQVVAGTPVVEMETGAS